MHTWIQLASKADIAQLSQHITPEYQPHIVAKSLIEGTTDSVKAILIETDYIDKDYRSTYYNFYAKKGQQYRKDCVRLHFFDEHVVYNKGGVTLATKDGDSLNHHYFGYMILRPTGIATIGRTVLSPFIRNCAKGLVVTAPHKVNLLGYKLGVLGFPSMDQHIDISVCAHAACWSILRHYSENYTVYSEYYTHDITRMAQHFNPGGLVPSKGLTVLHAERVFQEAKTFPVLVSRTNLGKNDLAFYRQLHSYIESGFPLFAAMQKKGHAVAVVGYDWKKNPRFIASKDTRYAWDILDSLVVVDDNHLPYLPVALEPPTATPGTANPIPDYTAEDIDAFIVALPEKIFYPADAVDKVAPELFCLNKYIELPEKDELVIRYFLMTSSKLRIFMRERESEFDPKLIEIIMGLPLAQYIWVVEFATQDEWNKGQISARAILDATASLREFMPLWLFHNRKKALIFDRQMVGFQISGELDLSGMADTALTRIEDNLTPVNSH